PPDSRPASVGGPGFFTFSGGAPAGLPYNRPMIRTARVLRSPRRPTALATCLLAALLLPGAGAADQERLRAAPLAVTGTPAALEMTLGPGVPVIEGRIGGKTLRLIVDTGATWSMLTPEAARAA